MNLPRRVGKRDSSQLEHYGIIAAEHIASAIGPQAGLPFGYDFVVTTAQMVGLIKGHNGSMDTTSVVRLFELEKVRAQALLFCLWRVQVGPKQGSETGSDHPIQGETFNPIVLRQICLEIPEVLRH